MRIWVKENYPGHYEEFCTKINNYKDKILSVN